MAHTRHTLFGLCGAVCLHDASGEDLARACSLEETIGAIFCWQQVDTCQHRSWGSKGVILVTLKWRVTMAMEFLKFPSDFAWGAATAAA